MPAVEPPAAPGADPGGLFRAPSLRRRLAAFVYEGVVLFGIVMIGSYLYDTLTQHRHALEGRTGLQIFLFLLLGVYFVWFWTHGGQTVAMKTWSIRLVDNRGHAVSQARAFARYVLAWLWFIPALATAWLYGPRSTWAIFGSMAAGVAVYATLAATNPRRQFLHDLICGTQLIDVRHVTPTEPGRGPPISRL
jgi:uncharacterized RDD family membrane protein YckC